MWTKLVKQSIFYSKQTLPCSLWGLYVAVFSAAEWGFEKTADLIYCDVWYSAKCVFHLFYICCVESCVYWRSTDNEIYTSCVQYLFSRCYILSCVSVIIHSCVKQCFILMCFASGCLHSCIPKGATGICYTGILSLTCHKLWCVAQLLWTRPELNLVWQDIWGILWFKVSDCKGSAFQVVYVL